MQRELRKSRIIHSRERIKDRAWNTDPMQRNNKKRQKRGTEDTFLFLGKSPHLALRRLFRKQNSPFP